MYRRHIFTDVCQLSTRVSCPPYRVLVGAWRTVQLRGEARLLHPLLVTGLKIWHLREGTSFYPKVQWQHTLALLPRGAQVVLVLGEIDCREGLATAVAHLKVSGVGREVCGCVCVCWEWAAAVGGRLGSGDHKQCGK